jgi:ubiquilin
MTLTLTIRLSTSSRFTLPAPDAPPITPSTTILQIKQLISQHQDSGHVEVGRQRLIYKGRILSENDKTLSDYGINEGSGETILYLVKGSGGAAPTAASAVGSAPAPPPPANPTPSNPFEMFNPMGGGAAGQIPNLQQMQQQLQSNPEFMNQMMSNPMIQSLLSNPDFMSNIMESNPQMQQVLNSNPELRQALRDPEIMRRSMEMMRDPSMMQQMMRSQDLAMSQIESEFGLFVGEAV